MTNPPNTIYLQLVDGDIDGATWCQDKIDAGDIQYIRLDWLQREFGRMLTADNELYVRERVRKILQRVAVSDD